MVATTNAQVIEAAPILRSLVEMHAGTLISVTDIVILGRRVVIEGAASAEVLGSAELKFAVSNVVAGITLMGYRSVEVNVNGVKALEENVNGTKAVEVVLKGELS